MRNQLGSKFKREHIGEGASFDVSSSSENILQKRAHNTYSDFTREVQPSRMSYDPKDFAYKMSGWQDDDNADRKTTHRDLGSKDNTEYSPNYDKRRWRNGCDFSRISYRQFVNFLKTGMLCGRRGHRMRFGFAGKR